MAADCDKLATSVAAYVATRQRTLGVARDTTVAMVGQRPVWEVGGLLLGACFARAAPVARVALVDRAVRRLLRVTEPSVVDGSMTPEHWFAPAGNGMPAVKVGLSDRTYWSLCSSLERKQGPATSGCEALRRPPAARRAPSRRGELTLRFHRSITSRSNPRRPFGPSP
jgi:hypothetical protein